VGVEQRLHRPGDIELRFSRILRLSRDALVKSGKLTERCIEFYQLTPREAEIIEELIQGRTNKYLADHLCISVKTVENHLYSIYQKIDVKTRLQLLHTLRSWTSE
jgi:DNA-binding CsgD family transcriptional regulator